MPTVTALSVDGLELSFLSNDHRPPHFHATRPGEWEIRVYILTTTERKLHYSIKWSRKGAEGPGGRLRRALRRAVAQHRVALLAEFEEKVNTDT